jgi:hypothetical protein
MMCGALACLFFLGHFATDIFGCVQIACEHFDVCALSVCISELVPYSTMQIHVHM